MKPWAEFIVGIYKAVRTVVMVEKANARRVINDRTIEWQIGRSVRRKRISMRSMSSLRQDLSEITEARRALRKRDWSAIHKAGLDLSARSRRPNQSRDLYAVYAHTRNRLDRAMFGQARKVAWKKLLEAVRGRKK
jgi:hypothetical protein